jgi:hypothetical protein
MGEILVGVRVNDVPVRLNDVGLTIALTGFVETVSGRILEDTAFGGNTEDVAFEKCVDGEELLSEIIGVVKRPILPSDTAK